MIEEEPELDSIIDMLNNTYFKKEVDHMKAAATRLPAIVGLISNGNLPPPKKPAANKKPMPLQPRNINSAKLKTPVKPPVDGKGLTKKHSFTGSGNQLAKGIIAHKRKGSNSEVQQVLTEKFEKADRELSVNNSRIETQSNYLTDTEQNEESKAELPSFSGAPVLWIRHHDSLMRKMSAKSNNSHNKGAVPGPYPYPPAPQKGNIKKRRYMNFRAFIDPMEMRPYKPPDRGYYYKFYTSEVKLIKYTLEDNGFRESLNSDQEWTMMWSTCSMKSQAYQCLHRYQKVNHFPRTTELTRKDCMYKNLARMQSQYGARHFDFIPKTFILPNELGELAEEMEKDRNVSWIIKPAASSQGKGIFVTNKLQEIPPKQSMIACRYIDNPLLIMGYKFDLRIYVALMSINPLRIYIFEEGLVRFATCKYSYHISKNMNNRFMHLTNYSVNKYNANFVANSDPDKESFSSKWGLTALRKYFKSHNIPDEAVWKRIEDIVIKSIISIESILNNATEMYVPYRGNCFEVLGFDVIIDDNLIPWLLETNLSPSLNCDSLLDQKIKAEMIADLFSMAGMVPVDQRYQGADKLGTKKQYNVYAPSMDPRLQYMIKRPPPKKKLHSHKFDPSPMGLPTVRDGQKQLTQEEKNILKESDEEFKRKGKFIRVFPSSNYQQYKPFFEEDRPLNVLLAQRLYKTINYNMRCLDNCVSSMKQQGESRVGKKNIHRTLPYNVENVQGTSGSTYSTTSSTKSGANSSGTHSTKSALPSYSAKFI